MVGLAWWLFMIFGPVFMNPIGLMVLAVILVSMALAVYSIYLDIKRFLKAGLRAVLGLT